MNIKIKIDFTECDFIKIKIANYYKDKCLLIFLIFSNYCYMHQF